MSHFNVLVVGDVDSQMEPFYDGNEEMYVYEEMTEEVTAAFYGEQRVAIAPDGAIFFRHAEEINAYLLPNPTAEYGSKVLPEGWTEKSMSFEELKAVGKQRYADLEQCNDDYYGYLNHDPSDPSTETDGEQLATRFWSGGNPSGRYDWYSMGGRWTGALMPLDGAESAVTGEPPAFGTSEPEFPGGVDSLEIHEVDWRAMRAIRMEQFGELYDSISAGTSQKWQGTIPDGMLRMDFVDQATALEVSHIITEGGSWYEDGDQDALCPDKPGLSWDKAVDQYLQTLDPYERISMVDCHC